MTLRPQIIRADTLDLQDADAPSAQDHTRQPAHPEPLGIGPAAPHQDAELRHLAEERTAEEHQLADAWNAGVLVRDGPDQYGRDVETSGDVSRNQNGAQFTEIPALQNGGEEMDSAEPEVDDRIEEDAMDDKMSSSPSIDDGGYKFHSACPESYAITFTPTRELAAPQHHPSLRRRGSVPKLSFLNGSPKSFPLHSQYVRSSLDHHLHGEYITPAPNSDITNDIDEEFNDSDWDLFETSPETASHQNNFKYDPTHPETSTNGTYTTSSSGRIPLLAQPKIATSSSPVSWITASDSSLEFADPLNEDDASDNDDVPFPSDPRFIDSGWGGECLRDVEDIDFDFVYALHNFVATVDGQANATKGDTMVLLDDTNSYWWLVRVIKDSSIGYLPAEHIETPTERLARLNKHRNIDLSATMLGDNPEKSKNPLKKAMRRRNAKVVTFTTPTYFEPSGMDWSDAEQDNIEAVDVLDAQGRRKGSQMDRSDMGVIDSVRVNGSDHDDGSAMNGSFSEDGRMVQDTERPANGTNDGQDDPLVKSRNGTMRNTDSFFKDDTVGPKKISLTPDLLRDESVSLRSSNSSDSKDRAFAVQDAFDQLGRTSPTSEKAREEKKRKEKKPNMLSGLFKRKDKKIKVDEAAGGTVARQDNNSSPVFSASENGRDSPNGRASPSTMLPQQLAQAKRIGGRVTPTKMTSTANNSPLSNVPKPEPDRLQSLRGRLSPSPITSPTETTALPEPEPDRLQSLRGRLSPSPMILPTQVAIATASTDLETVWKRETSQPLYNQAAVRAMAPPSIERDTAEKTNDEAPKARMMSPEPIYEPPTLSEYPVPPIIQQTPVQARLSQPDQRPAPNVQGYRVPEPDQGQVPLEPNTLVNSSSYQTHLQPTAPPEVSVNGRKMPFDHKPETREIPAVLEPEPKSSTEESLSTAPASEPLLATPSTSSPATTPAPITPPQESAEPAWDDAALRAYLDGGLSNDVRDMLVVVRDKTGVVPLAKDHPTMLELGFHNQQKQLDDMSSQLDSMLSGYLARRAAAKPRTPL